jgi:hypothetical protein
MIEQMQVWFRLFGSENFEGELDYLLGLRAHLKQTEAPVLAWRIATHTSDATFIQGSTVQRWGRQQRQFLPQHAQQPPDLMRPFAVLEPTLASVPASLRCDPRSREALIALWEAFDTEIAPTRLKFSVGQRCFELLSRIQNRFTSQSLYQLDHPGGTLANLQPASTQLHLSPQAKPATILQATWRRRAANTSMNERFEQLPLPQALNVYCQRTTRRLFGNRLRTARICVRAQAVIRLGEHSDQTLAILVHLQAGQRQFIDIVHHLGWDEHSLGNVLLGLYLSGIVELELDTAISTLFAVEPRKAKKPLSTISL